MAEKGLNRPRWGFEAPPDYDDILDGINLHEQDTHSKVFKYKKNWEGYSEKISVTEIYKIEALSSYVTRLTGKTTFGVDLVMLLWARGLEYFSRSHMVVSLKFLSHMRMYPFMRRNLRNGFLKKVSLRRVGARRQDVYYLSSEGIDLADKVYEKLIEKQ